MASALLFRRWSMSESAGAVSESGGAVLKVYVNILELQL